MIYLANHSQAIFLWFLPFLFLLAIWIWTIVDIVRSEFKNSSDKMLYLALTLAIPFIGTVIYLALGRSKRIRSDYS